MEVGWRVGGRAVGPAGSRGSRTGEHLGEEFRYGSACEAWLLVCVRAGGAPMLVGGAMVCKLSLLWAPGGPPHRRPAFARWILQSGPNVGFLF
ncbi:hypothetical protein BDY21DRAFT_335353 [Lineolata rhizophorae]|uniref:Uncharacterized protein n=1 Tax=Lineolata rhizophorae TaxID=578093 RepID=A0A6A6P8Z0_9PEZI|nr:hypothetical protein BDY21DRAFT_335353 [Lineolata rhizophorae]